MNLTKEQIKKINEIHENTIDPNYNPSDPFLVLSDQAYPYLISTGNWSDFKNLLDQFYYGTEDDKVTYYDVLGVNNFEDVKKMSPKNIVDKIGKYDYEEGGDFLEFWGANTSDEIYKLIKNEVDDEYLTEDDLNQIHDIIFNPSKKIKGDSKMKKDEEPRSELVENFKKIATKLDPTIDSKKLFNTNYPLFGTVGNEDPIMISYNFIWKPFFDNIWGVDIRTEEDYVDVRDWFINKTSIKKVPESIEDLKKLSNKEMATFIKMVDEYSDVYTNDIEGIKEYITDWKDEYEYYESEDSIQDSKQEQICDSFNKRYKGDK